ncbi:MAG TPA: UDP-N-acetylmuramoyl-L-alanine--D-glutamate ligase [Alphaproteobacteria bacterium]
MIDVSALKNQFGQIAVLGLGVSGQAVVKALQHHNVPFTVWDDLADTRDKAAANGLTVADPLQTLTVNDLAIQSAGMKPDHAILTALHARNITVWNDLDLLYFAAPQARYIGITGTNGKSTTTSLIGHILQENGLSVAIGGNLGPSAPSLPVLDAHGIYVMELSSYQLHSAKSLRCDIAVCLNITEDHVDWHGSMDAYMKAKTLIFRPRDQKIQQAIIGLDTPPTHHLFDTLKQSHHHRVIGVTQQAAAPHDNQLTLIDGVLYEQQLCIDALPPHPVLRGAHNIENQMIAFAACRAIGLSANHILDAMQSFGGLKHRQQPVGSIGPVTFINDSKGTNVDATAKALATFNDIYWIVGGKDTEEGIDGLETFYPQIRQAYLIGYATERFAKKLDGQLPYKRCDTIANAVRVAFADAQKNGGPANILLSPACKSFDQYANFEQRGDDFIAQVTTLMKEEAA